MEESMEGFVETTEASYKQQQATVNNNEQHKQQQFSAYNKSNPDMSCEI